MFDGPKIPVTQVLVGYVASDLHGHPHMYALPAPTLKNTKKKNVKSGKYYFGTPISFYSTKKY